jgi:hypothetical protein
LANLIGVPDLPPHLIRRHDRLAEIKSALRADFLRPVGITAQALRPGLAGMGGIGKSVLAKTIAHDGEIRRMFPDGIVWVTVGQNADDRILHTLQQSVMRGFKQPDDFGDVYVGKSRLKQLLQDKRVLVILDDVWKKDQAEAFNALGPLCRMMITTRDAGLVHSLGGTQYAVELLTDSEARVLIAEWAQTPVGMLEPLASRVIEFCGHLPLALALCGAMVHKGTRWVDLVGQFERKNLEYVATRHGIEGYPLDGVHAAIAIGVATLPPAEHARFAELSVFPPDRASPEYAIHTLWAHTGNLAEPDSRELLNELHARSLVILDTVQGDHRPVRLHTLLHAFASNLRTDRKALHQTLLDAYQEKCPNGGWPSGPNDGYFLQNLVGHLLEAGRLDDSVAMLTDLHWIKAKCRVGLVFSLEDDYRQTIGTLPEAQAELAEQQKRQARLARWGAELTTYARAWSDRRQRLAQGESVRADEPEFPEIPDSCRVWTDDEIAAECQRLADHPTRLDRLRAFGAFVDSECYPLLDFGAHPGFAAHHACNRFPGDPVREAGREILKSACMPAILRSWPVEARYTPKTATLRRLEGHGDSVWTVSVTSDGGRAVSGSSDNTLRVWDLESGRCLRTLEGHGRSISCVSVTPDGRCAVSASDDNTLRVWDLESGRCLRTLESGQCLRTLVGQGGSVNTASVTPDGRRVVSASYDKSLRMWDLESGQCLGVFAASAQVASMGLAEGGVKLVIGTKTGEVVFCELVGSVERFPAICTGHRLPSEPRPNCRCPSCGSVFAAPISLASAINPSRGDSLGASLPALPLSAIDELPLRAVCPNCGRGLRFNSFYVDASDPAHESRLRRGLESCRRDLGDHPDTLGHLAALAFHLRAVGNETEATDLTRLHNEMAERLKCRSAT